MKNKQSITDWISPKLLLKSSPTHGKGFFAKETIYQGELVIVWGGDNYVGGKQALLAKNNGKLLMQRDEDLFSIEDRGENDSYFINHSCNGNLWMDGAFRLLAKRDILVGEEITADYALWEADLNKISKRTCNCGEDGCRIKVTGQDFLLPSIQEKYRGHFSPLINKRIERLEG